MYSYPHKTAYGPLSGISWNDYAPLLKGKGRGLYLHIPFCQTKCGYCNLFSVTGQGEEGANQYLEAVGRQIRQYQGLAGCHTEFSDFTIGGGTPLLLTVGQLEWAFDQVFSRFRFRPDRRVVVETAPNQTEKEKLAALKQAGVTRVSMGIQSFSDQELAALGRRHRAEKARKALDLLMSFDFACVNVDFIYGIPGQTVDSLLASLKEALSYQPDEVFLYPLYVKHGAKLVKALDDGLVLDPGLAFRQYQEASRFLRSAGYRQDSMRRFVAGRREGRLFSECGFGTSLALGCGGRSYVGNLHFCTPYEVTQARCMARLREFENTEDFLAITHGILLSDEELKRRYVIRHLLLYPGLSERRYEKHFGSRAKKDFPLLEKWEGQGLVEEKEGDPEGREVFLSLTETGMGLSDYLGPQLISPQVQKKMEEWETAHGS